MTQKADQPTTAVQPANLSPEAIQQAMIAAGLITPGSGGADFNRVRIDGTRFTFGGTKDEPEFVIDSPSSGAPAFRAQLLADVVEYYGRYFDETDAGLANRPGIANKMCKSHTADPQEAGDLAEDGTACRSCPVSHFITKREEDRLPFWNGRVAKKCSWMGDLEFRLLDEDGKVSDDRIWTLSLTPTGMIEWQGSFGDKSKGYISDQSSKQKLALLAITKAPADPANAIKAATFALHNGGVLVEGRILRAAVGENKFSVPSFTPIDIIEVEGESDAPAIATTEQPSDDNPSGVPF